MKLLVIGCGSIGKRHIRNLLRISGTVVLAHDAMPDRLRAVASEYGLRGYTDLDAALEEKPDGVLVCTPPSSHVPLARRVLEAGAHLFIEKPLADGFAGVDDLLEDARSGGRCVLVGYNLRFHEGLRRLKRVLDEGRIGCVYAARAEFSVHVPDYRPEFREIYMARRDQGGGVFLDHSHEFDYLRWLLGEVRRVGAVASGLHPLGSDTEEIAEVTLEFESGAIAGVHLDVVGRPYSRGCKLIGERGTVVWTYPEKGVNVFSAEGKRWERVGEGVGGEVLDDAPYIAEMRHFLACVEGKESPLVDGFSGRRVLEIALAARRAAETGRIVEV